MNRIATQVALVMGLIMLFAIPTAMAQQQFVYPQKGQSAELQKKDEYDCHSWAVKQTGFDPTQAAQAPQQQEAQQPAGAQRGSGARGAAMEKKEECHERCCDYRCRKKLRWSL